MKILHVCTSDRSGGAEKAAYELYLSSRLFGHQTYLAVGNKSIDDDNIFEIDNDSDRNPWARFWRRHQRRLNKEHHGLPARASGWAANLGELNRWFDWQRGYEDFNYPGSKRLLSSFESAPDVVHLHNLHGNYFDLREIASISSRLPVFVTLHDEWLLTGHCAYTFDCAKWETGCGECPRLDTYPALKRDGTHRNFAIRSGIYKKSRLYVSSPSRWLLDRAKRSALSVSIADSKVIPLGIDQSLFQPGDRARCRHMIGVPPDQVVFLYLANKAKQSQYKDFSTIERTISMIASSTRSKITFLIIGTEGESQDNGQITVKYSGYQSDPAMIATFYQAADVFLHAAYADNFPYTVIEALSCGVPVIATAVGGIPEQIVDGFNGFLVPPGDSSSMAAKAIDLLNSPSLMMQMSQNASLDARNKYDLNHKTAEYLKWYETAVDLHNHQP